MSWSLEARFERYCDRLIETLRPADREQPARWYLQGLLLPGERKSIEPMAARVHPERVRSAHHSMHHLVAKANWSDAALLSTVPRTVLPKLVEEDELVYWIVDDTGVSEEGEPVGRRGPPILWPDGQAGQLPGCRFAVDRERPRESVGWDFSCTCRRSGPTTGRGAARWASPRSWGSRPSRVWRGSTLRRPWRRGIRTAWFWPMPRMGMRRPGGKRWPVGAAVCRRCTSGNDGVVG